MPNYRRYFVSGGSYFFTVKTEHRAPIFRDATRVTLLGDLLRQMKEKWPLRVDAIVVLPDHLHSIWSLPPGDDRYPMRWGWTKKEFTKEYLDAGGQEAFQSASRQRHRRRGVWQRRYWEHLITDADEFEAYFDYVHWNPVKHGYAAAPRDWPHSAFHRWVERGVYDPDWGRGDMPSTVRSVKAAGE